MPGRPHRLSPEATASPAATHRRGTLAYVGMTRIITVILLIAAIALPAGSTERRKTSSKAKTSQKSSKKKRKKAAAKAPVVITESYDGIDVSSHQKEIDWSRVAADANVRFVYIKATEGATYVSPHYETNAAQARERGIKVGSYHFLRTTATLKEQFDNFTRVAKPELQDLLPVIDFENRGNWSDKQISDSLEAFAQMLSGYYGCQPMIYTSSNFYNKYLAKSFKEYRLWVARYHPDEPTLSGQAQYVLWQFTDNAKLDGITTAVDMSRFAPGKDLADIMISRDDTRQAILAEEPGGQPAMEPEPATPDAALPARPAKAAAVPAERGATYSTQYPTRRPKK